MTEKLNNNESYLNGRLKAIKDFISELLTAYNIAAVKVTIDDYGTSFQIEAEKLQDTEFLHTLHVIAVNNSDNVDFDVTNVNKLIIRVTDKSPDARPILH